MKELSDVINSQAVDTELLNAVKRGNLFVKKNLDGSEAGQTVEGQFEVLEEFKAKTVETSGDINSAGRVGTGLNSNGNSPIQFNVGNNFNGVLFYDNSELNVRNRFKIDITSAEEGYSLLHSGNTDYKKVTAKNIDINSYLPDYKDVILIQDGNMEIGADYELIIYLNYAVDLVKKVPLVRYTLDGNLWYNLNIEPSEYKDNIVKTFVIPIEQPTNTLDFKLQMTRSANDYSLLLNMAKVVLKKGI